MKPEDQIPKKLRLHRLISAMTIFTGVALLTFMVMFEDELGALPSALITGGTAWHLYIRHKLRFRRT